MLKDAGFSLFFYYGSNPAFDNMQSFLQYHGFDHLMTEKDYVEEKRHHGWAVPDRIVLSQALAASNARPPNESQYNLVMTLTNHHPFDRPEDLPPQVEKRVRAAVANRDPSVGEDDLKRLDTLSYTDFALGEILSTLEASSAAADSLIVIGGDHSTSDYVLWHDSGKVPDDERHVAHSRIPFLIVFPEALIRSSKNPERVQKLVFELNQMLSERPVSQNDVPRILLRLLSSSPALATLVDPWRWHNLGGQALSPYFRVEAAPDARVIGIDASSRLFWLTETGKLVDPDEPASPSFDVEGARRITPTLGPEAALLATFMQGYQHRCWEWQLIRHVK